MKRLIIVRHAKSVPFGYDDDINRDLMSRGVSDAEKISLRLREMGVFPDLVISSPAIRAMHTASIYCLNLGYELVSIRQENILYDGLTTQDFIDLLQKLPEDVQTVFVFGHNPTVYNLVYNLVKYFRTDMPTCSTVALEFEVDKWQEVSARGAQEAFQLTPKAI
jgi:phosphohistidine phosphatase